MYIYIYVCIYIYTYVYTHIIYIYNLFYMYIYIYLMCTILFVWLSPIEALTAAPQLNSSWSAVHPAKTLPRVDPYAVHSIG